ncbi:copper amine oxidase [Nitzschia inconspicua]|uniref:Copper amine oxidase n=1 Tax=Nitzschia inconspicua TaxID=303405 RepID=A0A9K3LFY2_9STRA|nr:copper amine oxidase [Nitzschia inconspicua]
MPPPPRPEGGEMFMPSSASTTASAQQQHMGKVENMEVELAEMRKAFAEYIATTQDLEINLDMELHEMQSKLDDSTVAYESLTQKLKTMEPMLRNLELSLGGTKKRLKDEAKLRRTAEIAQVEAETRTQQVRDENAVLREECEALRDELEHKVRENDQLKREHETSRQQLKEFTNRLGSSIQTRRDGRTDHSFLRNVDSGVITEAASNKSRMLSDTTLPVDESYAEVLDELETVTEQLIETQQKLWRTEDQLRESEATAASLQSDIRSLKKNQKSQAREKQLQRELEQVRKELAVTKRELQESQEDDQTEDQLRESEATAASLQSDIRSLKKNQKSQAREKQLQRELEQVRKELAVTKRELQESQEDDQTSGTSLSEQETKMQEQNDRIERLKDLIEELEENAKMSQEQINGMEALLEESQEENIRLVEEIASLRIILHDEVNVQESQAFMKESISREVRSQVLKEAREAREKEINALREEFKKVFRENTGLKEKLEKLENGHPSIVAGGDEKLKKEVERLTSEVLQVQEEHKKALLEAEASWKQKLEQVTTGAFIPEDLLEEMEEEMKTAIDSAAERFRNLQADKDALESKVDSLERELIFSESKVSSSYARIQESESNLKACKDEILRLKKCNTHLTSELEYTTRIMARMDAECERLTRQHSELKAELEVALQIIESGGLDQETVNSEEVLKAKEKVHRLTSNLNKLKGDYSALLNELEATREHFLDAQEKAAKQNEEEMKELNDIILELEERLQKATIDNRDVSQKLQQARKKEVDTASVKQNVADLEKELKESNPGLKDLQKELKHCKDALSSSRIENKRLEEEIEKLRAENPRNRLSRDSDPVEETINRDPPSITRILKGDHFESRSQEMEDFGKGKELFLMSREFKASQEKFYEVEDMLRSTEQKLQKTEQELEKSKFETVELRMEVKTLKVALHDAHAMHSEAAHQLELVKRECDELRRSTSDGTALTTKALGGVILEELEEQIQILKDEKTSLQHQVDDSKIALSVSEYAQERMKEDLRTCQAKHKVSQESVQALKEDLKKLAGAFSGLRTDHEALLVEFESYQIKKEALPEATENEFHVELKELVEGNSDLRAFVSLVEKKLQEYQNEISSKTKQIEALECSLVTTQEEARLLSEEITNLSTAFENAQAEYDAVVDELEAVQSLFEKSRAAAEQSGKDSAAHELYQKFAEEGERQKKVMTAQLEKAFTANIELQRELTETEQRLSEALKVSGRNDDSLGFQREAEILQSALSDSQNEVKALKERCFELEVLVKQTLKGKEDEAVDQPINEKILSAVFDSEEMQDLKDQFNALIDENINLEQVVRESELALTLAKDVEERNKSEMAKLERDLSDLKSTKLRLQEEVYNLTVELENSSDEHLAVLAEAREAMKAESESKAQSLRFQIESLTIENASLRNRVQKLAENESQTEWKEDLRRVKMELQKAMDERTKAFKEKAEANARLFELETTSKFFAEQVNSLRTELQNSHHQKSDVKKRLDNNTGVKSHSSEFSEENLSQDSELDRLRADFAATMEIFERINSSLASVDFLERYHEISLRSHHAHLSSVSQKAEEIRRKIAFLTYAFQREKKEHSDVLFQLQSVKIRLDNLDETRNESDLLKKLQEEQVRLEERLEATDVSLQKALDSEEQHKVELDLCEKKYQESQKAALHFKEQMHKLEEIMQDSKGNHSALNNHFGQDSLDLVTTSEEENTVVNEKALFQRFTRENKELQSRLDETEAALAAARNMKLVYEEKLRQFDSDDSFTEIEKDDDTSDLPSDDGELCSKTFNEDSLIPVYTQSGNAPNDPSPSLEDDDQSHHDQAKIRFLTSQFQNLNEQSDALAKQVQNVENAVTIASDKQNMLKNDADARKSLTQALQSRIDHEKQRKMELMELTILMENKVEHTAASVEKLEHQLSSTKSSTEISRTDLLISQGRESAARLEELVKQRMGVNSRKQKVTSLSDETPTVDSEDVAACTEVSEEEDENVEILHIHSTASEAKNIGEIRDGSEFPQPVYPVIGSDSNVASLALWSTFLSNNNVAVSSVPMVAGDFPGVDSNAQERSISPFTLSLLSDNTINNTTGSIGDMVDVTTTSPSEGATTLASSRLLSNNGTNTNEGEILCSLEDGRPMDGPILSSTAEESVQILETRSDCGSEQRE